MATIYVINASTLVSDTNVRKMTTACDIQLREHLCPAWGIAGVSAQFVAEKQVPTGGWVVAVVDTDPTSQDGVLGWHTEDGTGVHGVVAAQPVLRQGRRPLTGRYSVASVLSHELCETATDPTCGLWADRGDGRLISYESADPVEDAIYRVADCDLSNFVTPAWFDAGAKTGPFDHLNTVHAPFTLSKGGYWVEQHAGRARQVFGEHMPTWRRELKAGRFSRGARRMGAS